MLHSMTGFGDAQYEENGLSFLVEVKSLNNRFLKTTVKLPDSLAFAEPEVDRIIREYLYRGSITFVLHMRQTEEGGVSDVNQSALQSYISSLEQILTLHGVDSSLNIDLATLMQLPGVCQPRTYSKDEHIQILEILTKLTREALKRLQAMRAEEGKGILEDLEKQCRVIRENLDQLSGLTDGVVDHYRKRIEQRVNELLADVNLKMDEQMLSKEVALFAERCDINEEISRLGSHLIQFSDVCHSNNREQTGRRLDFLTQELLREANTIASKANDSKISQHVVEIKVAIDRLREQVQNIE